MSIKQATEELHTQVLRYETLMDMSQDSIYVLNEKGDLQEANTAFLQRRGYTAADMTRLNVADWDAQWGPDQLQERRRKLKDRSSVFETRHRCKDGSIFDVEVCATGLVMDGKQLIFCVTRDITTRKKVESALRQLAQVGGASSDYIALIGRDFRYQFVNDTYLKARGLRLDEMIGRHMKEIVGQERFEQLGQLQVEACLRGEEVESFEWTDFRSDLRCYLHVKGTPLREPNGTISGAVMSGRDITARYEAEEALRESEQRFRELAENIHEVFWMSDPENARMFYVSPAYETIWGRSRETLYSSPGSWMDAIHPDDKERMVRTRTNRDSALPHDNTYRIVRPDGSVRWIRDRGFPVHDERGAVVRFAGIAEDITGSKQTAEAQERALSLMQATLESTADGILVVNTDGKIEAFNHLFARMWRLSEEVLASNEDARALDCVLDQLHQPEKFLEKVNYLYQHPLEESFDRLIFKDGRVFERYSRPQLIGGKVAGRVWSFRDVTDRRRAVEALRESEQQIRLFMEATADCLWNWDLITGTVVRSVGFERAFGYSAKEVDSSQTWWEERLHPDDRGRVLSTFQDTLTGGGTTCSYEYRFRRKDGTLAVIQDRAYIVRDPKGKALRALGAMTDITERRQAAQELEEANDRLRFLSGRLFQVQEDERRHLARELHDEIGQTLTAAKINLQIIAQEVPEKMTGRLNDSIRLLDRLLGQVRQLSLNLRPPLLDELGLVPALRWLVDQQAQRAGLHVTFRTEINAMAIDPTVQTTCFRVAQEAMTNIIRHSGAQKVAVALRRRAGRLWLSVRDDGAGFDAAAPARETASLGLVSMKERILLVGGGLEVCSTRGKGTEISAWFPVAIGRRPSRTETS